MFQDLPPPPPIVEEAPTAEECCALPVEVPSAQQIVITASREDEELDQNSSAISVITPLEVEQLGEERAVGLLRLLPSTSLAETGPRGTQAQLRIRGAEANHTLLFVDGIKANDPAAGNEARFELAANGLFDLIEMARGPQSALWGSEALGGVVALRSLAAGQGDRIIANAEYGSFDSLSGSGRLAVGSDENGIIFALGGQRSDGIDSFGEDGEKDGYHNLHARLSGKVKLSDSFDLLVSGFAIDAHSEFDGFDPQSFLRADTLDASDYRLGAGRVALEYAASKDVDFTIGASLLGSENINSLADSEANRTTAQRFSMDGQGSYRFEAGNFDHRLTLAVDHENEEFDADDVAFGGFTAQEQQRDRTGFTAEWFANDEGGGSVQIAIRHDVFGDFADATSFSAGGLLPLSDTLSVIANYGEGIAQPTFYDLYGFFPNSFVGNPALKPESSRGYDIGLRFDDGTFSASALWFQQNLKDEIVDIFDSTTFTSTTANGDGKSKRSGIELETAYRPSAAFQLAANYSYLDAKGPQVAAGTRLRETRRSKHRGAIYATGEAGALSYGASLAIVGARFDDDFDLFPAARVKLDAYALASARIAYEVNDAVELTLRGTNLFDSDYQDVIGYQTQGRAVFLGIRFAH